jgi:HAD superfamily hydrolase (TIGR01490 family)
LAADAADNQERSGQPKKAAAFFDLDRTLMAGASAFQFGRAAAKAGLVSRRQLAADALANLRFRLQGATDEATDQLRVRVQNQLRGVPEREILRLTPDMLTGILPRVYPQMVDIAYDHQDAGREVYIVTAAAQGVAELIASVLRFDGAIGTVWEVVDGVVTGEIVGPFTYGEGKAVAIRELAAERNLDLEASYAYSDSVSDLPMMRVVGHAVAVNPDAGLLEVATREGWEIITFERLGARLKLAAGAMMAAVIGGAGSMLVARRRTQPIGMAGAARRFSRSQYRRRRAGVRRRPEIRRRPRRRGRR